MQVCNAFKVSRTLLFSKGSIQIRTNADVVGISCQLADMVQVIEKSSQGHVSLLWGTFSPNPTRTEHPGIKYATNNGSASDQGLDHVIRKLSVVVYKRTTIVVAGPNWPLKQIQGIPKSEVAEVGGIQYHPQIIHFAKQVLP